MGQIYMCRLLAAKPAPFPARQQAYYCVVFGGEKGGVKEHGVYLDETRDQNLSYGLHAPCTFSPLSFVCHVQLMCVLDGSYVIMPRNQTTAAAAVHCCLQQHTFIQSSVSVRCRLLRLDIIEVFQPPAKRTLFLEEV